MSTPKNLLKIVKQTLLPNYAYQPVWKSFAENLYENITKSLEGHVLSVKEKSKDILDNLSVFWLYPAEKVSLSFQDNLSALYQDLLHAWVDDYLSNDDSPRTWFCCGQSKHFSEHCTKCGAIIIFIPKCSDECVYNSTSHFFVKKDKNMRVCEQAQKYKNKSIEFSPNDLCEITFSPFIRAHLEDGFYTVFQGETFIAKQKRFEELLEPISELKGNIQDLTYFYGRTHYPSLKARVEKWKNLDKSLPTSRQNDTQEYGDDVTHYENVTKEELDREMDEWQEKRKIEKIQNSKNQSQMCCESIETIKFCKDHLDLVWYIPSDESHMNESDLALYQGYSSSDSDLEKGNMNTIMNLQNFVYIWKARMKMKIYWLRFLKHYQVDSEEKKEFELSPEAKELFKFLQLSSDGRKLYFPEDVTRGAMCAFGSGYLNLIVNSPIYKKTGKAGISLALTLSLLPHQNYDAKKLVEIYEFLSVKTENEPMVYNPATWDETNDVYIYDV